MSDYSQQTANPSGTGNGGAPAADHQWVLLDDPIPGVRRITFNRADKRNSLIHPLRGAILGALRDADDDDSVKVSILRGDGPSFSAGYDLGGNNAEHDLPFFTAQGEGQWPRHVTEGWMSIWDLAKPVIAQVHGYCLAGGSELATCCDLVYVAEDAQMGYPATRFGVPDMHFHAWFMGMRKAMEMMFTGRFMSAEEGHDAGVSNYLVEADDFQEKLREFAQEVENGPPIGQKVGKLMAYRTANLDYESALELSGGVLPLVQNSFDRIEGVQSFVERRDPKFTGF